MIMVNENMVFPAAQEPEQQQEQEHMAVSKRSYNVVDESESVDEANEHGHVIQTTKSKGILNVQLFIRKAFAMINECDPAIASWTPEGDKFLVKDKELFASKIIPQYYDHNNYSSFTRQLNFYGFSREQSMCIKITEEEAGSAGQETFYHPFFQRGRPDLLKNLQRKSRDGDKRKRKKPKVDDVDMLQEKINNLEHENADMEMTIRRLEDTASMSKMAIKKLEYQQSAKDMTLDSMKNHIDRLEQQLNALVNYQHRHHHQQQQNNSTGGNRHHHQQQQQSSAPAPSLALHAAAPLAPPPVSGPTLAPHPNKKQFQEADEVNDFPTAGPTERENSLDMFLARDTSSLSRETSMMNWLSRLGSR